MCLLVRLASCCKYKYLTLIYGVAPNDKIKSTIQKHSHESTESWHSFDTHKPEALYALAEIRIMFAYDLIAYHLRVN